MEQLTLHLFGAFEARTNDGPVSGIEMNKVRGLLAYLAHEYNRPQRRETLTGLLWPESPTSRAHQSLSQALYTLRRALREKLSWEPLLVSSQEVCFQLDERTWLDTSEFNRIYDACSTHLHGSVARCSDCLKKLSRISSLYLGELLAGFYLDGCAEFEVWIDNLRQHYQLRAVQMWEWLAAGAEQQHDYLSAIEAWRTLLNFDPYNETALRNLMRLQARHVGRNEAIRTYTSFQDLLLRDLQLQPEPETTQLYESIRNHADRAHTLPPTNLPTPLSALIGREEELNELYLKLVDPQNRLVTLLGPGGSGKTSLALKAARALLPAFPDGVYLLEMSGLTSPEVLLPAIARITTAPLSSPGEIGAASGAGDQAFAQQLFKHLENRDILLVLDSYETLLPSASLLADLLRRAPGLHALVTSRARLNLKGEQVIELRGLELYASPTQALPGPAIHLFASTAQKKQPQFSLSERNLPVITRICQAVEGMPLGILLAAAWTSLIDPNEIERQIQADLNFLSAGWYDLPAHQRSLRATFDYSWAFLNPQQRQALSRLAVFRQSFTSQTAQSLCQVDLAMLKVLNDHSLLQTSADGRYRLHDLIHSFSLEKLHEDPAGWHALNESFSQHYLNALHGWGEESITDRFPEAIAEMDLEIENARQAWDWAVRCHNWEGLLFACAGLYRYYRLRNRISDIVNASQEVIKAIDCEGRGPDNIRLWLRASLYDALMNPGLTFTERIAGLERLTHELEHPAWADLDLRLERAELARHQGNLLTNVDNIAAGQLLQHSLELYRQVGSRWQVASVLCNLGNCYETEGKTELERMVLEEALTLNGPQDDLLLLDKIYHYLGLIYLFAGQVEQGMEFVCLKGQLFSRNSMFGYELPVRPEIGTQLMWAGAFREAYEIYSRYMEYTQKRNLPMDPALRVANAFLELSLGFYETVEKSLEWSQSNDLKSHLQMLQSALLLTRGDFNQASQIGEAAYTHILAIPDHRVSAFAASLVSMAHYRLEHAQLSRRYLLEALAIIEQTQNIIGLAFGLNYAALLLAEAGDLEAAVAVQACIADHPQVRNSIWLADLFGKPIAALGAQLDPDIRKKALRRGQDCQPVEVVTQMKDCLQADDDFTAGLESFARIMTG